MLPHPPLEELGSAGGEFLSGVAACYRRPFFRVSAGMESRKLAWLSSVTRRWTQERPTAKHRAAAVLEAAVALVRSLPVY